MSNRKKLTSELIMRLEEAFEMDSVLRSGRTILTRSELRLLERRGLVSKTLASGGVRVFDWRQTGGGVMK